jgi:hypothetical protein
MLNLASVPQVPTAGMKMEMLVGGREMALEETAGVLNDVAEALRLRERLAGKRRKRYVVLWAILKCAALNPSLGLWSGSRTPSGSSQGAFRRGHVKVELLFSSD